MSRPVVQFWYEFASTYSYPAAMRIEDLAERRGVELRWRPFLLGPIFAEAGWTTSPFNLLPVKGAYMWRDLERICASSGLPFTRPDPFPQNGLKAARIATALAPEQVPLFSRAVYLAEFGEGWRIDDEKMLATLITRAGANAEEILTLSAGGEAKARLRASVEEAKALGIFGAPSVTCADGELFWGNDRLEQAMDHALATHIPQ